VKDGLGKATWAIITGESLVPRWFSKGVHKIFFKSEPRFGLQTNPLAGDYSFNGVVDAEDYAVWRDTLGSTNDLRADGSSVASVPEPAGLPLVGLAGVLGMLQTTRSVRGRG